LIFNGPEDSGVYSLAMNRDGELIRTQSMGISILLPWTTFKERLIGFENAIVPLLMPAVGIGTDPICFGIAMALPFNIALMTPPVGARSFVACQISRISPARLSKAMWPYIYFDEQSDRRSPVTRTVCYIPYW